MANQDQNRDTTQNNPVKDPGDWATGDEPITGPQESYLSTLAQQAGREVNFEGMTKAQGSKLIEELQDATGREGGTGTTSVDGEDVQQAGN